MRNREERVRREAREKAERERVVEGRMRAEQAREAEQVRSEGGKWMVAEAGSGRKKKGKGGGLVSPLNNGGVGSKGAAASTSSGGPANNSHGLAKKQFKENERSAESSGRAGTWGPKKILSRKDGAAALASVSDGLNGANGGKK